MTMIQSRVGLLVLLSTVTIARAQTKLATTFSWPVSPVSSYNTNSGPFLDLSFGGTKYHLGEDWNANDGYDYGDPVYAIANGRVVDVQNISFPDSWGKVSVIKHTLPNGESVYSLIAHSKDLWVSSGNVVTGGQEISTIGNGNGYYGSGGKNAHPHLEIRRDPNWKTNPKGYALSPLNLADAHRYLNPSLFIDDRATVQMMALAANRWQTIVPWSDSSPALVYITYAGQDMSYESAVAKGLVEAKIQYRWLGNWRWNNLASTEANWWDEAEYRIRAKKTGVIFNLLIPGHNYQTERAVEDMIAFTAADPGFTSCQPETIQNVSGIDADRFVFRQMSCLYEYPNGGKTAFSVYHATFVEHPLVRYITFPDSATGELYEWKLFLPGQINP